ncbi:hypothetical protein PQZ38_00745 [Pelagibacteraceae bacterium]|nr:hypothetical protein [Pelagibacteraceae bacterium]
MISFLRLNKLILTVIFFTAFTSINSIADDETIDIWKNNDLDRQESDKDKNENIRDIEIQSPTLSGDVNKITVSINENQIVESDNSVVGIFDPEENNFNLNMWSHTDGQEIKKVLKRINKLKLSRLSENLLFEILFTNSYAPKNNLSSKEFLKIKINWLIKKKRIKDLELLLKNNLEAGQNSKAIKFLVNEYLSSADIKSACDKISFVSKDIKNNYLEKFKIYCLINNDQLDEAQLIFDLFLEKKSKDKFFESKINFLLGVSDKTDQKIIDNNLLNFYLSYITNSDFKYEPNEKTDAYIWKFLASANLVEVNNFEDENIILAYEQAAKQNSFDSDEIFKIYLRMNFNFNQLSNAEEIYKNLPNYKARALIYQTIMLSDDVEKKISRTFLLKDLFIKDNLSGIYSEELSNILKSIDPNSIPEDYEELVKDNIDKQLMQRVKFDNDILHRSKVIKHFLDNNEELGRTQKDLKSVYKKIKKNKKYFISIKDIIVFESLATDGIILPEGLDYTSLSSQLTVPKNLEELVAKKQLGLVMLKIVEIIGEDDVNDLDAETLYFLNKILNNMNLKKIRNTILSEALPIKV